MFAALGVLLLVAGAILTFGVDQAVDGADLATIGYILMLGGGLSLVIGAIQGAGWLSMSKNHMRSERHVSSDGQHVVEETHTA